MRACLHDVARSLAHLPSAVPRPQCAAAGIEVKKPKEKKPKASKAGASKAKAGAKRKASDDSDDAVRACNARTPARPLPLFIAASPRGSRIVILSVGMRWQEDEEDEEAEGDDEEDVDVDGGADRLVDDADEAMAEEEQAAPPPPSAKKEKKAKKAKASPKAEEDVEMEVRAACRVPPGSGARVPLASRRRGHGMGSLAACASLAATAIACERSLASRVATRIGRRRRRRRRSSPKRARRPRKQSWRTTTRWRRRSSTALDRPTRQLLGVRPRSPGLRMIWQVKPKKKKAKAAKAAAMRPAEEEEEQGVEEEEGEPAAEKDDDYDEDDEVRSHLSRIELVT